MRILSACAVGVCLLSLAWSAPGANPPAEAAGLSLQQAVAAVLEHNPDLKAFEFRLRAQAARNGLAAQRPAAELSLDVEDVLGSGRVKAADAAQFTLALSQVLELGSKREARVAGADAALDLLRVEAQARQLDVLAELVRRYIHVASDQEQLRLTRLGTELARQTVRATQKRLDVAKAPAVELRRARVSLAQAELEEEHAEHELLSSRRKLAALWGTTEPEFGEVTARLYDLPALGDFEALQAGLARNPDALRFVSEARLREAELRLAESRRSADVSLSAGLRRLQETQDQALVFGVSVPLFAGRRAQPEIAEAEARREQTAAEREAHRIRVQAQLFELYQELRHARTEAGTLHDKVLPEMEAALEETRYAFERGRYGYLEWVEVQRERIAVQRRLIEAAAKAHLHLAEIERLTGQALSASKNE